MFAIDTHSNILIACFDVLRLSNGQDPVDISKHVKNKDSIFSNIQNGENLGDDICAPWRGAWNDDPHAIFSVKVNQSLGLFKSNTSMAILNKLFGRSFIRTVYNFEMVGLLVSVFCPRQLTQTRCRGSITGVRYPSQTVQKTRNKFWSIFSLAKWGQEAGNWSSAFLLYRFHRQKSSNRNRLVSYWTTHSEKRMVWCIETPISRQFYKAIERSPTASGQL